MGGKENGTGRKGKVNKRKRHCGGEMKIIKTTKKRKRSNKYFGAVEEEESLA